MILDFQRTNHWAMLGGQEHTNLLCTPSSASFSALSNLHCHLLSLILHSPNYKRNFSNIILPSLLSLKEYLLESLANMYLSNPNTTTSVTVQFVLANAGYDFL